MDRVLIVLGVLRAVEGAVVHEPGRQGVEGVGEQPAAAAPTFARKFREKKFCQEGKGFWGRPNWGRGVW